MKDTCPIQIENRRGKAFYEILFMNHLAGGCEVGHHCNSLGNDHAVSNDVMDARFRALNADTLKKEDGSDAILINGPRRLMANSAAVMDGAGWLQAESDGRSPPARARHLRNP